VFNVGVSLLHAFLPNDQSNLAQIGLKVI
jgi:hypothetical protein